mgnify:CR=1 FL=1
MLNDKEELLVSWFKGNYSYSNRHAKENILVKNEFSKCDKIVI